MILIEKLRPNGCVNTALGLTETEQGTFDMADSLNTDPAEIWKPIPGWEGLYEASSVGRIRSLARVDCAGRQRKGKILNPFDKEGKYRRVCLYRNGASKLCGVHQLVATAFIGERPSDMEVCHNNGDGNDNRLENLRYGTRKANALDRILHGNQFHPRGAQCASAKLTEAEAASIISRGKYAPLIVMVEDYKKQYGISRSTVKRILNGSIWAHIPR